jgi:hypothetical protein
MDVEEVNVTGLQLLEGSLNRDTERLGAVASIVGGLTRPDCRVGEAGCELGSQDHVIAVLALREPFADPSLRLLVLVVVGAIVTLALASSLDIKGGNAAMHLFSTLNVRIDEIAALVVEVVQDLKHSLLVAFAHELRPRVAEVHGSEA